MRRPGVSACPTLLAVPMITTYDGARLAVTTRGGAGDGPPLLLIAGQSLSGAAWDPIATDYARRYGLITYDHRGTGASDVTFPADPGAWTTREAARDALAVLDGLGIDRAHVYGHSMGGRIAQWLAAEAPDRVAALVLGATTGGDFLGVARPERISAALASGDDAVLGPLFYTDAWLAAHPRDAALPMRTASLVARRAHYAASQSHNAWSVLGAIEAPTLIIHAMDDEVCPPENARLLAAAIPGAEALLLEQGRHAYYAGSSQANEAVLAFLDRAA